VNEENLPSDHDPFSREKVAEYRANGGSACLFCGSGEVEYGPFDSEIVEALSVWLPVVCRACGADWHECFEFSGLVR
jgi:hypothetical protein